MNIDYIADTRFHAMLPGCKTCHANLLSTTTKQEKEKQKRICYRKESDEIRKDNMLPHVRKKVNFRAFNRSSIYLKLLSPQNHSFLSQLFLWEYLVLGVTWTS